MKSNTFSGFGTNAFTSESFPSQQRIQAWEQHNATSLVALQAAPGATTKFAATGINLNTPNVDIARVRCTPHKVSRTAHEISAHPVKGAVIYLNLARRGTFWHRHRRLVLDPWEVLIVDGDQIFNREFRFGTDEYVFRISRSLLAQVTQQRNFAQPQVFSAISPFPTSFAVTALRALAAQTLTQKHHDWDALASKTSSLLSLILGEQPVDLFEPARDLIHQHCTDPGFGAHELAIALGVSTRQLTRIFASHNTSVAKEFLQSRLNHAQRMLQEGGHRSLTIADIAAASGFTSQAHFSRSYRKMFGVSPLQHRNQLLSQP